MKPNKIWSRPDYDAGYRDGAADMAKTFLDALTAVGIKVMAEPYLELRGNRAVMLFRAILFNQDGEEFLKPKETAPSPPAPE